MRKKGICFLVMSLLVVTGYLVAIAGSPSPGWITRWTDGIDGAQIGTLYFNTYVSANYRNDAGTNPDFNEYYTYHWAQVTGASGKDFKIEFRHSPAIAIPGDDVWCIDNANQPYPDANSATGVYEYSRIHITNDVPHNSTYSPYTSLRPLPEPDGGGGTGEVISRLLPDITIP